MWGICIVSHDGFLAKQLHSCTSTI